jgi:hypothetical protein
MAKLPFAKKTVFISVKIKQLKSEKLDVLSQDHDRVAIKLKKELEKANFRVFLSTSEHTDEWKIRIKQEIKDCFAFILVSSNAEYINQSEAIRDELIDLIDYSKETNNTPKIFKRLHTPEFDVNLIKDEKIRLGIDSFHYEEFKMSSLPSISKSINSLIEDLIEKETKYDENREINKQTPEIQKLIDELVGRYQIIQRWKDENEESISKLKIDDKNKNDLIHYYSNLNKNTINSVLTELKAYLTLFNEFTDKMKKSQLVVTTLFSEQETNEIIQILEQALIRKPYTYFFNLKKIKKRSKSNTTITDAFKKIDSAINKKYYNKQKNKEHILQNTSIYTLEDLEQFSKNIKDISGDEIYSIPIRRNISFAINIIHFSITKSFLFKREVYKIEYNLNDASLK